MVRLDAFHDTSDVQWQNYGFWYPVILVVIQNDKEDACADHEVSQTWDSTLQKSSTKSLFLYF
jgi:hypothetical protein